MKIARGHHVSFSVRDLAKARHFYGTVLGLREIARPEMGFAGAWFGAGDTEVHLIARPDGVETGSPPPRLTPLADHAAFQIDDYAAAVAHLRAAGLEVLETRPEIGQLWVQDPDGHVIELIEPARRA